MRRLDALGLVRLHELAEVLGRDADADPRLVHRDRVDARLAEPAVERLQPVGADAHEVVDELRPVVDVGREVDEAAHLGRHVPGADHVVEPPGLVADLLDHALEHRHVVEVGGREVAERGSFFSGSSPLSRKSWHDVPKPSSVR